ncbi:MAG: DDE-type integrase/transposase/recombinase [Nitrososphaeraceae archaeon]
MAKLKESSRTSSKYVYYALHLYFFSGLSLRKTSQRLSQFIKRNHVSIWNWIQRYKTKKDILQKRCKLSKYIIDETLIKVGSDYVWLWVAIEPTNKTILGIRISIERNMFVAEQFIQSLIRRYGRHNISTDGGTWYPQACRFLNVKHHNHSSIEKSFIERTIEYIIKDNTECFDDYFPCKRNNDCKLKHVMNWLSLFVDITIEKLRKRLLSEESAL